MTYPTSNHPNYREFIGAYFAVQNGGDKRLTVKEMSAKLKNQTILTDFLIE